MYIVSLLPHQAISASGTGPDIDASNAILSGQAALTTLNTTGTAPTLDVKAQHSAPRTLDYSYQTAGSTDNKVKAGASTTVQVANVFTKSGAGSIKEAVLQLKKIGTIAASQTLTLSVYSDSTGSPGSLLGASDTVAIDTAVGVGYAPVAFNFSTPVDLADATVYHLVLSGSYTASSSNCVCWRSKTVASGGTLITWNGSDTWTATTTEILECYTKVLSFSDISGFAFTEATTGAALSTVSFVAPSVLKHLRLKWTIGGTVGPAYYASAIFIVRRNDGTGGP